jgi:Zn-dependent M28 family amino/carboxypeptidase
VDGEVRVSALEQHVRALAETIGERNLGRPEALEEAARYVERAFSESGYRPGAQSYSVEGAPVRNIEAALPGASSEVLLVGAHYDTAPGTPGANDNASGVAALLELANSLRGERFEREIRFVAFVNEEPPYFQSDAMGSRVYARRCRERGERLAGMLSLETIGYYTDAPGSQRYPFPFNLYYPKTGNFLGFVGNLHSRALVSRLSRRFREASGFPTESAAVPEWFPGVDLSDHWSFWQEGYRAVLITDTAMFRYPYYHTPHDLPDKVDYEKLARVVRGLRDAVAELGRARG